MKELLKLPIYRNTFGIYCRRPGSSSEHGDDNCEWLEKDEFRCHLFKGRYLEADSIDQVQTPRRTWDCKELDKVAVYIPSEEEIKARENFERVR